MRKSMQRALLLTTILSVPAFAHAQTAPAPATAANDSSEVSEIVITAQKREQRLQDVPVPVTALGERQMKAQGIEGTGDLTRVVPGLIFVRNTAFAQPSIRGIGTRSTSAGDSSSVAQYIDGVYLAGPQAGVFDFGYVERIEVLKGPQGTLFGRNATGGAINIITRTPSREAFAEAEVGYGSYDLFTAKAYATGPLTDTVRADVQGFYKKDSGYIHNIANGHTLKSADNNGFRTKVVWDVSDKVTVTGTLDYIWNANNTDYALQAINGNNNRKRLTPATLLATDPYEIAFTFDPGQKTRQTGAAVITDVDLGLAKLKSISSYRTLRNTNYYDTDGTSFAGTGIMLRARGQTYTQEFILTSTGDSRLSWLAGLFFIDDKNQRNPQTTFTTDINTGATRSDVSVKTMSYAPYGELTFKATDRLTLIGGLRYSYERKVRDLSVNGVVKKDGESTNWDHLDYRLTAQFFVNDHLNFYGTASTGFKSGTYNAASATNPPVRPETVDALELGFKFSSHGIVFNADAFRYTQKDIQVQKAFDPVLGGAFLQNAAAARIQGVEVEFRAPLGDYFTVNLGGTLMKGEYTSYKNADVTTPIVGGGNTSINLDVTGRPTYRTPERTFNAGLTFRHDLGGGVFTANGSAYYSSKFSWEASNRLQEPSHTLYNARASWSPQNERYVISVWGDNLSDEFYYVNAVASTSGDSGNMGPPRRFGVTLSIRTN